jgi:hypothetical protein
MRQLGAKGGSTVTEARLKHLKRMTKERVKAQKAAARNK